MSVLVDTREHVQEVVKSIKEAGCSLVKVKLEVGDYVAGEFLFERKSTSDFVNSIIDGRLFTQASLLVKSGLRPAVIVEGDLWDELSHREIHQNAVLGAQLALLAMGVGLIYSEGPAQTGSLICLAAKRGERRVRVPTVRKTENIREAQIAFLSALPGIGPKRAEELLKKYGTPLNAILNYRSWEIDSKKHAVIKRILETPFGSTLDKFL